MKNPLFAAILPFLALGFACAEDQVDDPMDKMAELSRKIAFSYHFDSKNGIISATLTAKDATAIAVTSDALGRGGPMHAQVRMRTEKTEARTGGGYRWNRLEPSRADVGDLDAVRLSTSVSLAYEDYLWNYVPAAWNAVADELDKNTNAGLEDVVVEFLFSPALYYREPGEPSVRYSGIRIINRDGAENGLFKVAIDVPRFRALREKQEELARQKKESRSDLLASVQLRPPVEGFSESVRQWLMPPSSENEGAIVIGCNFGGIGEATENKIIEYPENWLDIVNKCNELIQPPANESN